MSDENAVDAVDEIPADQEVQPDEAGIPGGEDQGAEGGTPGPEEGSTEDKGEGGKDGGKPQVKPEEKKPEEKYSIKIDGEEREFTLKQLQRAAQQGLPAVKQLGEIKSRVEDTEKFIQDFQNDPIGILERSFYVKYGQAGVDTVHDYILKSAADILQERSEKNPEVRRLRHEAREAKWVREENERLRRENQEVSQRAAIEEETESKMAEIREAFESQGIDPDSDESLWIDVVKEILEDLDDGNLTAEDAVQIVLKRRGETGLPLDKLSDDDLAKYPELIERAHQLKMRAIKEQKASPKGQAQKKTAPQSKGRESPRAFDHWNIRPSYDYEEVK